MRTISRTSVRVATTMCTVVALIATVGAPFKWSFLVSLW